VINVKINGRYPSVNKTFFILFIFNILVFFTLIGCDDGGGGGGVEPPPGVTENKLNREILDATILPDGRPIVTFRLTDDEGNPIGTDGVSMNWVISRIERGGLVYLSCRQESTVC
jgi:hypothetical protein